LAGGVTWSLPLGSNGLCMVVSDHPLSRFVVNPENLLAHQKVIVRGDEGVQKCDPNQVWKYCGNSR